MPGGEGFAAMGEFFQDFMGPEGAEGMGPDGPGLAAGARNFFNPNSEGGFDPTMFFEDARGMDDGMDPFGMGPNDTLANMGLNPDGTMPEDFDEFGGRGAAFFNDDGVEQFQPPVAFD